MSSATVPVLRRRHLMIAALLAASLTAGCGVETSSEGLKGKGSGTTTTEPEVPCGDDHDGDIIGVPGSGSNCTPDPEPAPDPDPTPTTEPDPEPDPEPSGDDDYAEALAIGLDALDDDDLPVDGDQAACIAPEWIDAVGGAEALEDAGITSDDLEDLDLEETFADLIDLATAEELVDDLGTCDVDVDELVRQAGIEDGQTEEEMDCFFALLPEGTVGAILAASLAGEDLDMDSPEVQAMGEAYATCVPEESGTGTPGD